MCDPESPDGGRRVDGGRGRNGHTNYTRITQRKYVATITIRDEPNSYTHTTGGNRNSNGCYEMAIQQYCTEKKNPKPKTKVN